jgi:hypothetical protein
MKLLVQVKGTSAGHCEPLEDVQPARNASEPMAFQPGIYIYINICNIVYLYIMCVCVESMNLCVSVM